MSQSPPPGYRAHRWVLFGVLLLAGALLVIGLVAQFAAQVVESSPP